MRLERPHRWPHVAAMPCIATLMDIGYPHFSVATNTMFADLHRRCGIGGAALTKALLSTGDRRPPYDRVETYGAGVATSEHLFVLSTGRPINPDIVTGMFVNLARRDGHRGGPGEATPRRP